MWKVRHAANNDGPRYVELLAALDSETEFLAYEPGERIYDVDAFDTSLTQAPDNRAMLVAEEDAELVGFLVAARFPHKRRSHCAHLAMAVRGPWQRQGIGSGLLTSGVTWAQERGITRLELTVMSDNAAAISLYRKAGFTVEGTKPDAYIVQGRYVDELIMGLEVLPESR